MQGGSFKRAMVSASFLKAVYPLYRKLWLVTERFFVLVDLIEGFVEVLLEAWQISFVHKPELLIPGHELFHHFINRG